MPSLPRSPKPLRPCLVLVLGPLLLASLGCAGTRSSGDQAGTANWVLHITPDQPSLATGQTLQFQATLPWGGEARWSVVPASAGSITSGGLFTASTSLGACTVLAVWSEDVRYTASTTATVLVPPAPAVSTPALVQASGAPQTSPGGTYANGAVVGETVPAITSTSASQTFQVRHGFLPGAAPSN